MPDTKQGSAAAAPAAATPEPLAAILAEMRLDADILVFPTLTPDKLRTYADRIEAAAERERNAHTNDIHNALYMATGIPGNAAAMREALERIVGCCEGCHADACEKVCRPELTSESIHAALSALDPTPRHPRPPHLPLTPTERKQ